MKVLWLAVFSICVASSLAEFDVVLANSMDDIRQWDNDLKERGIEEASAPCAFCDTVTPACGCTCPPCTTTTEPPPCSSTTTTTPKPTTTTTTTPKPTSTSTTTLPPTTTTTTTLPPTTTKTTTLPPTTTTTTTLPPTTTKTTTLPPTTTTTTTLPPTTTTTTTLPPTTTTRKPPAEPGPLCPPIVSSICEKTVPNQLGVVLLPYPGDCLRYCRCGTDYAYQHDCPTGLHFNADIFSCDLPAEAQCSVSRTLQDYQ